MYIIVEVFILGVSYIREFFFFLRQLPEIQDGAYTDVSHCL